MGFAQANQPQEDDVGFFFHELEPEEVLDLEPIDLFGPVPAEALQGFEHREAGVFDPAGQGAVLAGGGFALDQAAQVVEVRPVVGGRLGGQQTAVGFEVRQLQVIETLVECGVSGTFGHGVSGSIGWAGHFIDGQIGRRQFDLQEALAPGEVQGALAQASSARAVRAGWRCNRC